MKSPRDIDLLLAIIAFGSALLGCSSYSFAVGRAFLGSMELAGGLVVILGIFAVLLEKIRQKR